ncbi:MAG: excinuclease ABC subunit C [Anaerolineaceae bacterium 4572_32.1]|nr:MAG: excinuclease ABC subunit C [Anaerolineaceae bacterium 4572_32.1]
MKRPDLKDLLNSIPAKTGVYLMKDERGTVIYVGKAINLHSRVRSYFHESAQEWPKTRRLVQRIADIEFIVTGSELEALVLESTLIKRHRPHFNVRLKDDKRYPYIKVTWQDDFPRVYFTRRMGDDGARYYGPYTSADAVRQTLELLRQIFPYLNCKREITGRDKRACLYYHIKRCAGPCIGAISKEDYRATIGRLCDFLEGKADEVLSDLRERMEAAAEALEFEKAARLRDQIRAVEKVIERQRVVSLTKADQDVIAFAREDGQACAQVFFIRRGRLIGREYFMLEGTEEEDSRQVMASFLKQFYDEAPYVPPEILLPEQVAEAMVIEQWLRSRRGTKVALKVPRRGQKKELVQMAVENAAETLIHLRAQWLADESQHTVALTELQEALELSGPPTRIEGYDISNIQGTAATGSMVVFVKGVACKSDYRRFRIKSVSGSNDFAMMQEVLRRRFKRAAMAREREEAQDRKWAIMPDLILIDGGKGQLNAALQVLEEYGLDDLTVAGLAKKNEEIFLPGQSEPVILPRGSQGLFLVQRVRDEAHRFAVAFHRNIRRKRGLASQLDAVPGIGPKRRSALLKHFGSLKAIRAAGVEELAAVPGMTGKAAQAIKDFL